MSRSDEKKGARCAPQTVDKGGKNVVFPPLWSSAENQFIDFPCLLSAAFCKPGNDMRFVINLRGASRPFACR
ncbi:hypothetical protein [Serratia marcescens]|uniref:Uncharacterized protein n=1 Tax=Serratia marcescens TaxID=615 RepID=A0ABD5IAZ6_SERMA|nr:hypothetical protein [Serratia marcescens]ELI8812519.1 hypothetical protein [Serratia marcescens]ELI8842337.1 hypothetical protein [Serratia marcescens]MDX7080803.1 hypothetical protein [Serratia marcescens]